MEENTQYHASGHTSTNTDKTDLPVVLGEEQNGEIKVFKSQQLIGIICRGEIRGEWWCEPINADGKLVSGKNMALRYLIYNSKEADFRPLPTHGINPIIIDYNRYKITFLLHNGVIVKFFKLYKNRWYKIKETAWDYFPIGDCISWAKSQIDNDETGYFHNRLMQEVNRKS